MDTLNPWHQQQYSSNWHLVEISTGILLAKYFQGKEQRTASGEDMVEFAATTSKRDSNWGNLNIDRYRCVRPVKKKVDASKLLAIFLEMFSFVFKCCVLGTCLVND